MDWKDYETTVKNIYEELGRGNGINILGHGHTCKVTGKSKTAHQIDVLTKHSDGIHSYSTAIECKYWNKTVNKDVVMKLNNVIQDCNIEKGVVVSKLGFTPDATTYAKHNGIGLVELNTASDIPDKKIPLDLIINKMICFAEIKAWEVDIINYKYKFDMPIDPYNSTICYPNGSSILLRDIFDDYLVKNSFDENFVGKIKDDIINFEEGTVLKISTLKDDFKIKSIKLQFFQNLFTNKKEIKNYDYIALIMKAIFEEKQYVITESGKIIEALNKEPPFTN